MAAADDKKHYFRESTRAPLKAPVTIQTDAFEEAISGHSGNISLGGLFVTTKQTVPVGTMVKFELHLEPPMGTVFGMAEVVWIRSGAASAEKPGGIGLQFRHLEDNGEVLVRKAVEEVLQAKGLTAEPPDVTTAPTPKKRVQPAARQKSSPPPPRAARPGPDAETDEKSRKKTTKKVSKKKKEGPSQKRKLFYAILLIATLIFLLMRTFG